MKISEIKVEGYFTIPSTMIVEASGISIGDNLLFLSADNTSQRIRQTLPFVNTVQVTRQFPNIVMIEISESSAIARITHAGETLVVDSSGRVLNIFTGVGEDDSMMSEHLRDIHLIDVRGIDVDTAVLGSAIRPVFGTEMKFQYMQDVLSAFEHENIENDVSYLDVSNIVNVHFGYLGRFRILLGGAANLRPSNLRFNMERLPDAVEDVDFRNPNATGTIDMSDINSLPVFSQN
jgi:cell division protein FtsQ